MTKSRAAAKPRVCPANLRIMGFSSGKGRVPGETREAEETGQGAGRSRGAGRRGRSGPRPRLRGVVPAQDVVQIRPRLTPFPAHGPIGYAKHLCRLLFREIAEVTKLHDALQAFIERAKFLERLVEREDLLEARHIRGVLLLEFHRELSTPAFLREPATRGIDEEMAHCLRRDGEKVRAILPCALAGSGKTQIRFIHDGGCAKRAGWSARKMPARDAAQVVVHEAVETFAGLFAAFANAGKESAELFGGGGGVGLHE